jgi:hypothetical protein
MTQPWLFILAMLAIGLTGLGIVFVIAIPTPNQKSCDRLFAEFMASKDAVIINRNGWLLYKLDCNVSRRYRQLQP